MKTLLTVFALALICLIEASGQEAKQNDFPPFPCQNLIEGHGKGKLVYISDDGSVFEKEIGSLNLFPIKLTKGNELFELTQVLPNEQRTQITTEYTRLNGETLVTNDLVNWYKLSSGTEAVPKAIKILSNDGNIEYLEISPNPSSEYIDLRFTLKTPTKLKISIVNANGESVEIANNMFTMGDNNLGITLERFKPGYHYLLIEGPGIFQGAKFIISK